MLSLAHFLLIGAVLFCLSVAGIFMNRKNVIVLLMCVELMLLAVNMNFIAFSHFNGDVTGQVFVFFYPDRSSCRSCDRACNFSRAIPQSKFD